MSRQKKARRGPGGGQITKAGNLLLSTSNCSTVYTKLQAPPKAHFQPLIDQAARFGADAARRGDIERVALHFEIWHSLECARYGLPYAPMFGGAR